MRKGISIINKIESNISKVLVGPFPNNNHIQKARETLIHLLDSLPEENIISAFIVKNIDKSFKFNANVVNGKLVANVIYNWLNLDIKSFSYSEGGTYLFTQNLDGSQYIGSAACFRDRIEQHCKQFRGVLPKSLHIQEKNKQKTLSFSIIHSTPSFFKLFRKENPKYKLTLGEYDILLAITIYSNRILEQNLIDQFKPSINGRGIYDTTVYHKFTNWDVKRLTQKMVDLRGSIPVNIYNLDGSLEYVANSYNDARKFLGMSYSSMPLYVDNSKPFFSKNQNKEFLIKTLLLIKDSELEPKVGGECKTPTSAANEGRFADSVIKKIEHKLKNVNVLNLINIKLTELSSLLLYCFDKDKKTFTTFFTITDAYKSLFPKAAANLIKTNKTFTGSYAIIRNRINIDSPVISENGNAYYFAKNPDRKEIDIKDNSVIWLVNINLLSAELYPNLKRIVDNNMFSEFKLTSRKCLYYKDTGKVYSGFIFF